MSLGRRISCTPRVPQFTPGSRLQVCANDVKVVAKSLRIIGETEAGGLLSPRAGLASINLVSPPSLSAQSQVLSSLPPRPPRAPHIFHEAAARLARALSPPPLPPGTRRSRPLGLCLLPPLSPLSFSQAPALLPTSPSGLRGLPQRANLTPNFLFCPFLGCFPVEGRGRATESRGETPGAGRGR